jgi:hypothetical protein
MSGSTRELFNCAGNPSLLPFLIRMAEPFFHSATPELLQLLTQFPNSNRTGAENA